MFEKIKKIEKTTMQNCYDIQMNDMGRGKKMFNVKSNFVANGIVCKNSGGDARASFGLTDTFANFPEAEEFKNKFPQAAEIAMKLEGNIRHCGIHAGAMVTTEKDISNYVPLTKIGGEIALAWEKQLIEDAKLIKFDILGLKTLSVLNDCIQDTGQSLPKTFDDKKVFETIFQDYNQMLGIFQFESTGLGRFAAQLKINDFKTLYHASVLFRPSALHSGQAMQYQNRKLGKEEVHYEHECLKEITKDTFGTIMFQEQIMQIMHDVAGLSWATSEMSRKIITKSKGKGAFEELRQEFIAGAKRQHNLSADESAKIFDVVSTFGSYGFCQIHGVEYAAISYYCAFYKTYFPIHFFKAILKYETDDNKINNYLQNAEQNNITIEYPDINKSEIYYSIQNNKIYSGFSAIKGIGVRTAQKIIKNQPYESFSDFIAKAKPSKKILKGLVIADCFRDFNINKKVCAEAADITKIHNYDDKFIPDYDAVEWAQIIFEHTTLKPKLDILKSFQWPDLNYVKISSLNEEEHGATQQVVRGIVTAIINKDKLIRPDIKLHKHEFEPHMIYLNVNDGTGNLAVQINPWTYTKYKDKMQELEKKPLIAMGVMTKDGQKMYADMIESPAIDGMQDITKYWTELKDLPEFQVLVASAQGAVSKNKKSYYRLKFSDNHEGLWFGCDFFIQPGMKVIYEIGEEPFVKKIKVIK